MKRPSRQELSAWILIAALVADVLVHFRSPAYRFYREKAADLDGRYSAFERRVEAEFVPAIRDVVTNMNLSVSSRGITEGVPKSGSVEYVTDYRQQYARTGGYSVSGCYIDGHFYRLGDRYLGSPLVEIEPSCAFTLDFIIRPQQRRTLEPLPKSQPAIEPGKVISHAAVDS